MDIRQSKISKTSLESYTNNRIKEEFFSPNNLKRKLMTEANEVRKSNLSKLSSSDRESISDRKRSTRLQTETLRMDENP